MHRKRWKLTRSILLLELLAICYPMNSVRVRMVTHLPTPAIQHTIPPTTTVTTITTLVTASTTTTEATRPVTVPQLSISIQPTELQVAETLVTQLSWPVKRAQAVEWCESRDNPNAESSDRAIGLFQELGGSFDPIENVKDAFALWSARGWEPWTASESCWSKIS